MTAENTEVSQPEDGNSAVVNSIKALKPITYEELYERAFANFTTGNWGHSPEEIDDILEMYLGKDFNKNNISQKKYKKKLIAVTEHVLAQRINEIQINGTSLIGENINYAMNGTLDVLGINLDLSETPLEECWAIINHRAENIEEITDTERVLYLGRRLFDWYSTGVISPEINSDILQMQDLYRSGAINREVLALYYYNVALAYEKYSSQKNNHQAISSEHNRSIKFMKKALDKTDTNISLIMTIKDFLADESHFDSQSVLDACHRVMDNNDDSRSLYLAHKLYAETLSESRKIRNFSADNYNEKITEHYRIALSYGTAKEDKLDILEALANHQKISDKPAYIHTQMEITELLTGRKRIRALKNLIYQVDDNKIKAHLLKKAINEFLELKDVRKEDLAMYNSLDAKLRIVAADEPKTIKKLDELQKKFKPRKQVDKQDPLYTQMSSKGHDVFSK